MSSKSNSLSKRSSITSICNNPKKPHLKPKPRACDVSGSKIKEESLNFIFSKASLKSLYRALSTGYKPQYTIGFNFLYPGNCCIAS